jgi:hypothetical protein
MLTRDEVKAIKKLKVRHYAMLQRCHNPRCPSYKNYGARGIEVCPRWRESFQNYMKDVGFPPSLGAQLHRKDNDKGYYKDNCIWLDPVVHGYISATEEMQKRAAQPKRGRTAKASGRP